MKSIGKILLTGVGITLLFKALPMRLWGLPIIVLVVLFLNRLVHPYEES